MLAETNQPPDGNVTIINQHVMLAPMAQLNGCGAAHEENGTRLYTLGSYSKPTLFIGHVPNSVLCHDARKQSNQVDAVVVYSAVVPLATAAEVITATSSFSAPNYLTPTAHALYTVYVGVYNEGQP